MSNAVGQPTLLARPRRGMILPLVLIVLAIAVILGMCFLTSASTATQLSSGVDHRLRARTIAESGLAMTLAYVEGERAWRTQRSNGVWITNCPLDGGTFTVSGEDGDHLDATGAVVGDGNLADDPADPVVLTCVGIYADARHVARAVRFAPPAAGIAVDERVEVKKTGLVDSYDPDRGPYAAATATAKAAAQSNGRARQVYVRLLNRARVNGNVYFGRDSILARAVTRDATAIVTGTISPLPANVPTTDIVEPNWASGSGPARSYSTGVTVLTSDAWYKRFEVKGDATLRVVGNVTMYVGGDLNVTEDAKIEVGYPMAYAAGVKGTVNVGSSVPIDSYDSSLGAYGGANVAAKALLATNSTAAAAVTVSSVIKGDAYSGVGSLPATSIVVAGGSISGTRAALTTPMAIPAPPAMPTDVPASVGSLAVSALMPLNANLQTGDLSISGQGVLRINGDRKIRVNGNLTIDGGGQLEVAPNSSLAIYVGGQITLSGNGTAANVVSKAPQRLVIYGLGSGYTHTFSGNAIFYGVLDAPNSTVRLDGNSSFYGAIMASSLITANNGELHNDRNPAVVDADPRLPASYSTGSKLTLYTNGKATFSQRARVNTTTMNPQLISIYYLGPQSMDVSDSATVYAETNAPNATMNITGASRWTGRVDARNLSIGGTAVVTADASGGTGRPGLLVEEALEVRDDAVVNATGGLDLLASRGSTDSVISLLDSATLKGDGYTAAGGDPSSEIRVGPTATFTGAKRALMYPLSIVALTAPPASGAPADLITTGTATSTISGDVFCNNFEISGDAVVNVDRDSRLVLGGDFRMFDNGRLVLNPGVRLTIFCPRNVQVCENAQLNVGGHPRRLTISCPAAQMIDLRDSAGLCANVLAPLAELKVNHTAEFYGAFTGRRVKIDRTAKFHCAQPAPGSLTWIETQ